jgi:hypothetical protein
MSEFLKIEGKRDEYVSGDGHGNTDNCALVEFWKLDFRPISWQAVHGGLEVERVWW